MDEVNPVQDVSEVVERMKETFPSSNDQLIPLLQFVQNELGYLPSGAMREIAHYLKVPPSHVYGVATFYAQFRFKPLGRNIFTVCRGTACHVRGSARLVEELERELDISAGDTTEDMMFSIETVACVGSCALAPVVVANKKVYGKATAKKLRSIISEMRGGETGKSEEAEEKQAAEPAAAKDKAKKKELAEKVSEKTPKEKKRPKKKKAAKKTAKKAAKKKAPKAAKKRAKSKVKKTTGKPAKKQAKKAQKKPVKKRTARKPTKKATKKAGTRSRQKPGPRKGSARKKR